MIMNRTSNMMVTSYGLHRLKDNIEIASNEIKMLRNGSQWKLKINFYEEMWFSSRKYVRI